MSRVLREGQRLPYRCNFALPSICARANAFEALAHACTWPVDLTRSRACERKTVRRCN